MPSKWSITMVIVSPPSRVVGPLPNGLNGLQMGVTNHALTNWDDPPSSYKISGRFGVDQDFP